MSEGELITDAHATETTGVYWEQAHPKPMAARQGIERIVKKALIAGYTTPQIVHALNSTKSFTVNAVEYYLRVALEPPKRRMDRKCGWHNDSCDTLIATSAVFVVVFCAQPSVPFLERFGAGGSPFLGHYFGACRSVS